MIGNLYHRVLILLAVILCSSTLHAQWKEVSLPAPFDDGYYLDVFFLPSNPNYGWCCSIQGYIIRTTDAGTTWQGTSIRNAFLEYVQFLNPLVGYVSGSAGVYRSTDGGRSWRDVTPNDPNSEKGWGSYWLSEFEGVYFVGGCATGLQAFYRTTDGGDSWSVSYGSEPLSGLSDGILFPDGTGYAVSSGVLWQTFDRGQSWRFFARTGSKVWTEEIAISGNSLLLPTSGNDCDGQTRGIGSMRFSRDGGRSWNETQTRANMFGSFLLDEQRGWGVGDERMVVYTADYGATWQLRNCGIRGNIDDIWFVSDTLGWAVGQGVYRSNFNAPGPFVAISPQEKIQAICPGDSLYVQATSSVAGLRWTDGVNAPGRFITKEGTYIVEAFDPSTCLTSADTIVVVLKSKVVPRITTSADVGCEGDSILASIVGPFTSWKWSTSDTTEKIAARASGRYSCTVVDTAGCTHTVAVQLTFRPRPKPVITTNRPPIICLDDVVELSAPGGFREYKWSTGSTTQTIVTGEGGQYAVTVTDEYGCTGTSDSVVVVKLDTRNKTEILGASASGAIEIRPHEVGSVECRDIVIRNKSVLDAFEVRAPYLIGNVFFSLPQSQFPIVIPTERTMTLRICASAIDTGFFADTLAIPDTCSAVKIPVVSTGLPLEFSGTSRCSVDVDAVVTRAGSRWQLSAPFPVPANARIQSGAVLVQGADGVVEVTLRDATGRVVQRAIAEKNGPAHMVDVDVSSLVPGIYAYTVTLDGEVQRTYFVSIVR